MAREASLTAVLDGAAGADFYELAPLYDFVYRRSFDYDAQAERVHGTPAERGVLELACGTGLLACRLVESYEYLGVDASPAMLAVAVDRVDAPFVRADARRIAFDRSFGTVAMLGRSTGHFGNDDLARVASVACEHLEDGVFLLDAHDRAAMEDGYTSEDVYETDRWRVVYSGRSATTGGGWCQHQYRYEVTDRETGGTRSIDGEYPLRFWDVDELAAILESGGFAQVRVKRDDGIIEATARAT